MITREHANERVLVVAHQVIVNCMRYLIENLDEAQILAIDKLGDVPNCGITSYRRDAAANALALDLVNFIAPLQESGAPVTAAPDVPAAPKP
jgi:broad specificity phosphatase PhoE